MYNGPFKWWVQNVMPLVFDDSLSYYEVLAKLTKYIEGLTGDVEQIEKILATIEGIEDVTEFTKFLENIQTEIGNLNNLQTANKTDLVSAINEIALKANNAYVKPSSGIPESDLSQGVQDKLNKTGEATKYIINNKELKAAPSNNSPADLGLGTYSVPTGGIPWDTLSQDVQDRINASGSGTGGTTDYTDLNNKPQINGHTLNAGNNTGESLGIGSYNKPATGIPESDLSEEVQEKLNTSGGIANSESDFVATRDYEAGELFYINGVLYKAKQKILSGTTLVPGNNIEETDINAELESINSKIDAMASGEGLNSWSLVYNITIESNDNSYHNFFEYVTLTGNERYLFIVTPTIQGSTYDRGYIIRCIKRDGTIVYTETVDQREDYENQYRFTFIPVDTGDYYFTVQLYPGGSTNAGAKLKIELEYTQSQGMTELWNKVNEAISVVGDVDGLETLVGQQQDQLDDITERVETLENDVDEIKLTQVPYEVDEKTDITTQLTLESNSAYLKPDLTTSASDIWRYYSIAVARGDAFIIQTVAGIAALPWILVNADNQVIAKAEPEETVALTNIKMVAPESGTLYINSRHQTTSDTITVYRGVVGNGTSQLRTDVNQLQSDVVQMQLDIDNLETDVSQLSFMDEKQTVEYTVTNNYYSTGVSVGATAGETGPFNNWQYATFPVTLGDKFEITSNAGQNARLYKIVDANNNILEVDSYSSSPEIRTVTVEVTQNSAVAIIVNCQPRAPVRAPIVYKLIRTIYYPSEKVIIENQPLDDYLELLTISHSDNPLWGKKLCCAGDSITYGADMESEGITDVSNITVYNCDGNGNFTQTTSGFRKTWGYQIAERNNMIFYNGGVSGSTMQGLSNNYGFSLADGRYTKLPDELDYLLIWFGWNDEAYGTLGTINDSTNESFYGGYNVVLPYLINKYPYAKIGLIVPYGTTPEHREAVRLLGNKWGVAVWDNYQGGTPLYYGKETSVGVNGSIVTENRAKFQANGAHPNYKGHKQLADMIEEWLKGI